MNVGNIVTNSKKIDLENFKNCRKVDNIDRDLPTLIIGWENVKKIYGEIDLDSFVNHCYNEFGEQLPYVYLDLLLGKRMINFRIIRKILSLNNPTTYISDNNMVYIYGDNIIFGLDLNVVKLFDGKYEKIVNKVKNLENNTLVDLEIFNKCEDLILKLKNKKKYIPYIYEYEHKR